MVKFMVMVIPMLTKLKLRNVRITLKISITMNKWTRSNGQLMTLTFPLNKKKNTFLFT